jgi:F420-non-reducing hydrogenase iron-sulfur subunit
MKWSPLVRNVRIMCTGRMDPTFVVEAFRQGADGVLISGCHPGDCHYNQGNYKALRRVHLLKRLLADFGVEPERLKLTWVSASEGDRWAEVTNEIAQTIRSLGPLRLEL